MSLITSSSLNELSQQPLLPFRFNRPGPAVAFADFDGDGEDDLALGGVAGESGQLLSNLGGGQFSPTARAGSGKM
jgi:hypothetical protein